MAYGRQDPYKDLNRCYTIVDFKDYREVGSRYRDPEIRMDGDFYAFSILVNLFHTKVVPLDFDSNSNFKMVAMAEKLITDPKVVGVDIINSSPSNQNKWHMIVQLTDLMNVCSFFSMVPNLCTGFTRCAQIYKESNLRVSQKFSKTKEWSNTVHYDSGFRKSKDGITSHTNFDFLIADLPVKEIKKRINLRS